MIVYTLTYNKFLILTKKLFSFITIVIVMHKCTLIHYFKNLFIFPKILHPFILTHMYIMIYCISYFSLNYYIKSNICTLIINLVLKFDFYQILLLLFTSRSIHLFHILNIYINRICARNVYQKCYFVMFSY